MTKIIFMCLWYALLLFSSWYWVRRFVKNVFPQKTNLLAVCTILVFWIVSTMWFLDKTIKFYYIIIGVITVILGVSIRYFIKAASNGSYDKTQIITASIVFILMAATVVYLIL